MTALAESALIPFPLDRVRSAAPGEGKASVTAEVVIFTGVRVERLDPHGVSPQPQKPRRAARKVRDGF